jgi:hypothetical protein
MAKRSLTRTFKTAWFSKAAKKARISDPALIPAIHEVIQGAAEQEHVPLDRAGKG